MQATTFSISHYICSGTNEKQTDTTAKIKNIQISTEGVTSMMETVKRTAEVYPHPEAKVKVGGIRKLGNAFSQVFAGMFWTVLLLQALAGLGVVALIVLGFFGVFN